MINGVLMGLNIGISRSNGGLTGKINHDRGFTLM